MHGQVGTVLAASVLLVLLSHVPTVPADCCGTEHTFSLGTGSFIGGYVNRCADCTQPRKYYCGVAGGGGCNIFGCNCGGGCIQPEPGRVCSATCCDSRQDRHGRRSPREVNSAAISTPSGNYTGHDVIIAGDLDKDCHRDEVEVHLYLTQRGVAVHDVIAWLELDSNSDGKLTAAEIDNELHTSIHDVTPV